MIFEIFIDFIILIFMIFNDFCEIENLFHSEFYV